MRLMPNNLDILKYLYFFIKVLIHKFLINLKYLLFIYLKKSMGMGDWGLGIGDWGLGPIPNPQSPIPNPQSPIIDFYYNNINKKII